MKKPLTREFLLARGYCCHNNCLNCPYNMAQLHETQMGHKLIEHTLPEIGRQLERIADILEKGKIKEFMDMFPNDQDLGQKVREYYTRFK